MHHSFLYACGIYADSHVFAPPRGVRWAYSIRTYTGTEWVRAYLRHHEPGTEWVRADSHVFAPPRMRLKGVCDTPLHGYMKNLCRSAGNVFTSRKSPGPFASKESGLGFLLCERAYPPYLSQNDSGNHIFIRYVSKKIPCRLAEPIFSGGYASRKSSCLRSRLACSTVIVIGSPKR